MSVWPFRSNSLTFASLTTMHADVDPQWLGSLRRYVLASACLHLVWEILQLPLYTIWWEPFSKQSFAILHCTAGDVMIASLSLLSALVLVGKPVWPQIGSRRVWLLLLLVGVGYTGFSEWLNVEVRGSWAYSPFMPRLPLSGTGLSPLLQWFIVPTVALWIAITRQPWRDGLDHSQVPTVNGGLARD